MRVAVLADDMQWAELTQGNDAGVFIRVSDDVVISDDFDAVVVLNKKSEQLPVVSGKPVLVNMVCDTLHSAGAAVNVLRINGWPGFIQRNTWEVAGNITEPVKQLFAAMGKQFVPVVDEPGLVAARSISMIINEAYFALGEEVSAKEAIDTAMKLGTNYPYGPFEWCDKIGIYNIYSLLSKLAEKDTVYTPAPQLQKEANS